MKRRLMMREKSNKWKLSGRIIIVFIFLWSIAFLAIDIMVRSAKMKDNAQIQKCDFQIETQALANIPIRTTTIEEIQKEIEGKSRITIAQRDDFVSVVSSHSQGEILILLSTERNFWKRNLFWPGRIIEFNPSGITYSGLCYEKGGEK